MHSSEEEGEIGQLQTKGFTFIAKILKNEKDQEQEVSRRSKKKKFMQKINQQKMESIVNKSIPTLPIEYFPLNSPLFINGYPYDFKKPYPMLIKVTKKNFIEPMLYELQLSDQEKKQMKQLPKGVRKFYLKRNFLFSKFKEGIKLDEESWYSVIPECIGKYVAQRLKQRVQQLKWNKVFIRDAFCGSGGFAIQLAQEFKNILASDLDPIKIQNLSNNMKVYGIDFKTEVANYLDIKLISDPEQTIMILCPPWGGTNYLKQESFDLDDNLTPTLKIILEKAIKISNNFLIQLPRNIKIKQLVTIFQQILPEKVKRFSLELETIYINEQINQIFVYYGDISSINLSQEVDLIYKNATLVHEYKQNLKQKIKTNDIREIYRHIIVEDQFTQVEQETVKIVEVQKIKKRIKKTKNQVKQWSLKSFMKKNKKINQKYQDI